MPKAKGSERNWLFSNVNPGSVGSGKLVVAGMMAVVSAVDVESEDGAHAMVRRKGRISRRCMEVAYIVEDNKYYLLPSSIDG